VGKRIRIFKSIGFIKTITAWCFCICCINTAYAKEINNAANFKQTAKWASIVKREGQAYLGVNSPTPMFLSQIHQESSGREWITAWDGGMGLTQFMPGTVKQATSLFPDLGTPDPYNPVWAIRAQVRYMSWIRKQVKGLNDCQKFAASLKGYNAGPGYVLQAQKKTTAPEIWFDHVEWIPTRQTAENFEYSRTYPRKILFKHQKIFLQYGTPLCLPDMYGEK
jgi:soluble lytic murein transglycosylase-like protein